jgi:hypothetical protein
MTKSNIAHKEQTFWSGLSMGFLFGASSLFLLGTKKGRSFLKQIMEATEDLEGLTDDILEEAKNYMNESKTPLVDQAEEVQQEKTIGSVIDKIQAVLPEKSDLKNFFVKDGKVLK